MSSSPANKAGDRADASSGAGDSLTHQIMFLLLSSAAFCLFAPTVLTPIAHEYGELLAEEDRLTQRVAALELSNRQRTRLAKAFSEDAVINERLAILDLRYRRPDEVVLPVLLNGGRPPAPAPRSEIAAIQDALILPDVFPLWVQRAADWAGDRGLIGMFLDSALRPIFLLMSAGLVIAAFVLFPPRPERTRTPTHRPTAGGGESISHAVS